MACDRTDEVQRYHDGELTLDERGQLEAHFHSCAECRQFLRELGRLSSLLRFAPVSEPGPEFVARMHAHSRAAARDVKTIRLAGWLTAAAAAVLIGALLLGPESVSEPAASAETWESMARATVEDASPDSVVLAQWMVDELSSPEQR